MALDLTNAFTIGGLDSAPGGNSARILCMTGAVEISSITPADAGGSALFDADGGITLKTGTGLSGDDYTTADFALSYGAGTVGVGANDADDETGDQIRLSFTFGDTVDDISQFQIVGATGSFAADADGVAATMAPGAAGVSLLGTGIDVNMVGGVTKMKGNTVSFILDTLSGEDVANIDLAAGTCISFSVIAIALPVHA
jgi:hypothetical protein